MSEVIPNSQPEQHQGQQQNVENIIQQHSHQQPTEQTTTTESGEQSSLTIDTNTEEPTNTGNNSGQIILSPRGDAAQRALNQQSAELMKGKLEIIKKLYSQHLDKFKALEDSERIFGQKQQKVNDLNAILSAAQRIETEKVNESTKKVAQKVRKISDLEAHLHNIKSQIVTVSHAERAEQMRTEISQANQRIHDRDIQTRNSIVQTRISQRVNSLTQTVEGLRNKKNQNESSVNDNRSKLNEGRSVLDGLLNKLLKVNSSENGSAKLSELETHQKNLEQQVESRRQEISKLKEELQAVRRLENTEAPLKTPDLTGLRTEVQEAKKSKAQLEKDIETTQREYKDAANKLKSTDTTIQNKKSKNAQLNDKIKKLEEEKAQLQKEVAEGQKKKQKFEQKVPQQLLELRARKAALQKEARQQAQKVDRQRNKEDNSVPASVIETMNLKITRIKEQNERYSKLIVENVSLKQENVKLDAFKEELQWQSNPEIRNAELNRQKEEVKHNILEEELSQLRKKNIQSTTKLDEYVAEYPDFKPQKKQKKPEPVPPQQANKKDNQQPQPQQAKKEVQQQPLVEEKAGKKKKNNKSSPQPTQIPVPEVVQEKPEPVLTQQKSTGKKQEQKPGKGKNKSPKAKEIQQLTQDVIKEQKQQPVNKQSPAKKVQAPVKKEASKIQQVVKTENKGQKGQGNKNNKKR